MKGKTIASIAVTAALVATLGPAAAFAAPADTNLTTAGNDAALQTQATKTMYVPIKKEYYIGNGDSLELKTTTKYTYSSKGLLTKRVTKTESGTLPVMKYTYKGKKLIKVSNPDASLKISYKKGKRAQATWVMAQSSTNKTVEKYTIKSGKLKKVKLVRYFTDPMTGEQGSNTQTVSYVYKKGVPAKMISSQGGHKVVTTIAYDAKGNLKKAKTGVAAAAKYTLKYDKHGSLVKRTDSDNNQAWVYTYKKINVPIGCVPVVKEQTWAITNDEPNGLSIAIGGIMMS